MENFKVTETVETVEKDGVKIVVIGVGGGGSNMVEHLLESDIADKVKLVSVNTDRQALDNSNIPNKLQIGEKITGGKGAGMKPEVGKAAAMENYEDIKKMLMNN